MLRACPQYSVVIGTLLYSSFVLAVIPQRSMPQPALPFVEKDVCPGEYCVYGRWTAQKTVPVFDTWQPDRHRIAQVAQKQNIVARTGLVVTSKPGTIRMDRDLPEQGLRKGAVLFTYTYRGEGYSAVWFRGMFYPDFDISFTKWPDGAGCGGTHCAATYTDLGEKTWWVEILLPNGKVGWVDATHASFDMHIKETR